MADLQPQFDHNKKEYLCERGCCCGPVHSRRATELIAILTGLFYTLPIVYNFIEQWRNGKPINELPKWNLNMLLILPYVLICCFFLFYGTRKVRPRLVYHFAGLWTLMTMGTVANVILFTVSTILPYSRVAKLWMEHSGVGKDVDLADEIALRITFSFAATVTLGLLLLELWCLFIIAHCLTYLQDLEAFNKRKHLVELVEVSIE